MIFIFSLFCQNGFSKVCENISGVQYKDSKLVAIILKLTS